MTVKKEIHDIKPNQMLLFDKEGNCRLETMITKKDMWSKLNKVICELTGCTDPTIPDLELEPSDNNLYTLRTMKRTGEHFVVAVFPRRNYMKLPIKY